MSALLDSRRVALLAGSDAEIDEAELEQRFGAGGFSVVRIDVDGEPSARASVLKGLDGDTGSSSSACDSCRIPELQGDLPEREKQFVRLPGALDARAIAIDLAPGRLATPRPSGRARLIGRRSRPPA